MGLELVEYPIKAFELDQVARLDNLLEECLEMLGSITILIGLMVHYNLLTARARSGGSR